MYALRRLGFSKTRLFTSSASLSLSSAAEVTWRKAAETRRVRRRRKCKRGGCIFSEGERKRIVYEKMAQLANACFLLIPSMSVYKGDLLILFFY